LKNLKTSDFDPMRPRAGISTSEIHFIISKMVSAVTADATEVPCPSTHPLAQTVYPLQGGKVHPNFENKKKFGKKFFQPPLRPEKYADSIGEIRF